MNTSVITGTGSYIPAQIKENSAFTNQVFYTADNNKINAAQDVIIDKFEKITGIAERRYVTDELSTSDISTIAAKAAIADSGIDAETLDMIIVAHNFGNVDKHSIQSDAVPSIASRVKYNLKISNPKCVGYDVLFGCPGWIQGLIQADAFFKAGIAKKALIIGAETLSRVIDIYDRDSMIFSDGAGAVILEYKEANEHNSGILGTASLTYSVDEAYYINMSGSYNPEQDIDIKYLKMKGRKVYEFALKHVPEAMKTCIDNSGISIDEVKKIFIHQANEKMDEAIVDALYKLYNFKQAPDNIMPMCIHYLGNSSVATVPTLYDLILKGKDACHSVADGDVVVFASVGAGMNINAVCYRK